MSNYIRFDWAMKRLLRNKANFAVLEGFLTTLLLKTVDIRSPKTVISVHFSSSKPMAMQIY